MCKKECVILNVFFFPLQLYTTSNVNPDLDYFDTSIILPCGIDGKGVTSIGKILQEREKDNGKKKKNDTTTTTTTTIPPTLMEVSQVVLESIQNVFGITNFVSKLPPDLR